MNIVIFTTETTQIIAMVSGGLGTGCLFASGLHAFLIGDRPTGLFRFGLAFGLVALLFMIRATMPA